MEGIRDLAVPQQQVFLTTAAFTQGSAGGANERFGVPSGTDPHFPKFAFSDVYPHVEPLRCLRHHRFHAGRRGLLHDHE